MNRTRLSLFYLCSYLLIGGFVLLFFPNEGLKLLLSNGDYGDIFPRVAGMFLAGLGITVFGIILTRSEALPPSRCLFARSFLRASPPSIGSLAIRSSSCFSPSLALVLC